MCSRTLPVEEFYWHDKHKGLRRAECKKCTGDKAKQNRYNINQKRNERNRGNPNYGFERYLQHIKSTYGISSEEYFKQLEEQKGVCAICGKTPEKHNKRGVYLYADHDHKTGKVRGLLCYFCNIGLGFFRDDISILKEASEYLEYYNVK